MAEYWQLLKDPRWQKRRLERLSAEGWRCMDCGDTHETLHVHHKRYVKGRDPWQYQDAELAVLCESCHERAHAMKTQLDWMLAFSSSSSAELVTGLLGGYLYAFEMLDEDVASKVASERKRDFEVGVAAWCIETAKEGFARQLIVEFQKKYNWFPVINKMVASWSEQGPGQESAT